MKTQVEKAYDRHTKWLEITRSFGGLRETEVQDIVQEMYVLLIRNTQKGVDFSYGDDINYYYCFRKVYEIIEEQGISISELSRKTDISYYSLYNTYCKVKSKLKELI